ncbi:MAG: uroporphyrinogen decarboxylase family protein [Phycisphaerae bacterium]
MTPREIFAANLTFDDPPRIGMALPEPFPNDTVHGGRASNVPEELEPKGNELHRWRDEWGVTWATLTEFDKGEVVAGAIEDWDDLEAYRPPDCGNYDDYVPQIREHFEQNPEQFRIGHLPGFTFNIARKLRRLDNYLCDLVLEREKVDRLHAIVRSELLKMIEGMARAGADAIMFPEDWGTQDRLMISPDMWRDIFRPEFEALAGRARELGMLVIMHSCGKMTAVLDDMIACGVNCFQFDQPTLHGIDLLAERFHGRAAFWCPVDIQRTLQTRNRDKIRREAREMVEKLGRGGGFIAGAYPSPRAIGITPEIQAIASEAYVEFGTFRPDVDQKTLQR